MQELLVLSGLLCIHHRSEPAQMTEMNMKSIILITPDLSVRKNPEM